MVKKLQVAVFAVMTLIAQGFIKQADAASSASVALDSVLNFTSPAICKEKKTAFVSTEKNLLTTALIEGISVAEKVSYELPSATPSITPTEAPIPVEVPSITREVTVTPTISPITLTPAASLNADIIFSLVNTHRVSLGLPAFEKEPGLCQLAADRAPEVYTEVYQTGNLHAGLRTRTTGFGVNENIISIGSEQAAVNWWLSSPIHRHAIENNYKYSCVACSGNSCSQVFSN